MSRLDLNRPGPWRELFPAAMRLMEHLERVTRDPIWSFGGGTVLMLRIHHRQSKDIDLFVQDPQYLGYVNPRLSDVAEDITHDYEEAAEYVKLFLPAGEIDVVVGSALTDHPFEIVEHEGRILRVETNAEILAKKMWHRGHRARARDLFDLCAVNDADPDAITVASPFMKRHGQRFLEVLDERGKVMQREFEMIDALDFKRPFAECVSMAREIIQVVL